MANKHERPATDGNGLEHGQVETLVEQFLGAPVPRPIQWANLSAPDAEKAWGKLAAWVSWLVNRYVLDGRELPPCWYLHGALVEELTALHGSWLVAYDDGQSAAAMVDWHRVLYETRHRTREWASRTGCSTHDHRDGSAPGWVGDEHDAWLADFTTAIRLDVTRRAPLATSTRR